MLKKRGHVQRWRITYDAQEQLLSRLKHDPQGPFEQQLALFVLDSQYTYQRTLHYWGLPNVTALVNWMVSYGRVLTKMM